MYDLNQYVYLDVVIPKRRNADESVALTDMVDRSDIKKALLLADTEVMSLTTFLPI